jgi:hypothetical protein
MSDAITQPAATEPPAATTTPDPATPEVKPAETSPSPKQDPTAASRFALAAKKEKEAQRRAQELRSKESEIAQRMKALEERESRFSSLRADPLAAIRELGVNLDPQTQALMGSFLQNQADTPDAKIAAMNQRLETMARSLAERDKQIAESQRKAEEDARARSVAGYRSELVGYAKQNAAEYEWAATFDADGSIAYEVAEALYKQSVDDGDPKMPDQKAVMDKVEAYFEGQFGKVAESKKFAAKFGGKFSPKPPAPPTTITQAMAQGSSANGAVLTEAERFARAMAALNAQK